jgi:transposase-like protein
MIQKEQHKSKDQIISEYLSGNESYKTLSEKYDVKLRTIQTWVRTFRMQSKTTSTSLNARENGNVKELRKKLAQAELKNELLEEMLRLSEEQTGIDFRKKFGTKQS